MSFERDELDGKYSLIGCRNTCVLLCMLLSCLAQTLECCLHCVSLPVIGQGMSVFKWLAVNRWTLSATFRGGKHVCFPSPAQLLFYRLLYEVMATGRTEAGEPSAVGVTAEQLAQLLGAVKDGMREELSSLKRELTSDRQAADDRLLKKLKLEKVPTFKKKAHEKQFVFNEEVSSKVEEATALRRWRRHLQLWRKQRPSSKKVRNC